jgi:hypothetical protein
MQKFRVYHNSYNTGFQMDFINGVTTQFGVI